MSWRTNRLMVLARHLGRTLGVNRRIAVWLNGRGYETRYDESFSGALRPGDPCGMSVPTSVITPDCFRNVSAALAGSLPSSQVQ